MSSKEKKSLVGLLGSIHRYTDYNVRISASIHVDETDLVRRPHAAEAKRPGSSCTRRRNEETADYQQEETVADGGRTDEH